MTLNEIKAKLHPLLTKINDEINEIMSRPKPPKINKGEYVVRVLAKLKTIIGNPILNPSMNCNEAELYYFYGENALHNIQNKYILILELQDYIIETANIPFIFDKFSILKLMQLTARDYNDFIEEWTNSPQCTDEQQQIINILLDLDTMMINDRMLGAENGTLNAKAIDTHNRYKRKSFGFGATFEEDGQNGNGGVANSKYIDATPEEAEKKLANQFGFVAIEETKKK